MIAETKRECVIRLFLLIQGWECFPFLWVGRLRHITSLPQSSACMWMHNSASLQGFEQKYPCSKWVEQL